MNYNDDDNNPFADSSIRQATAASYSNQPAVNEYNPFTNATVPARPAPPPQQPSVAAVLPPAPPAAYVTPSYASVTTPFARQQSTEKYGYDTKPTVSTPVPAPPAPAPAPAATRLDLSQYERQQSELDAREKRLAERERALTSPGKIGQRDNNFPPLPAICPCRPCFYQDIGIEIPPQFQLWVRYIYYLWLAYSLTLLLNMIAALAYFVVDKDGAATFGLSLVYLVLFIPLAYVCWFRPVYRAFREDSASGFMIFFLVFFIQLVINVLQFFGIANLGCGFILMIQLFSAGGKKIFVGLLVMLVTCSFAMIALVGGLLMIKVHRLYRQTDASLEKAQKELQTTFVNNPTVRGAAREVATAGINEAVRGVSSQQQQPIY